MLTPLTCPWACCPCGAGGHHGRDSGNSRTTTVGVIRDSRGGLNQLATLAAEVCVDESGTPEDFRVIWILGGQRSPTPGDLQGTDVGPPHRLQQVPWGNVIRSGGDLEADAGQFCDVGDGGRGQGGL